MAKYDGAAALAKIAEAINKEFGKGSAIILGSGGETVRGDVTDVIPFRIGVVDNYVLGIGGLVAGRVYELFADEGAGKTSMLLQALASCQREDGIAALEESESALYTERLSVFGVDPERLLIGQSDTMEEALGHIESVLKHAPRGDHPMLIGWDSVAAAPPKEELLSGVEDPGRDMRAKIMSSALRQLVPLAAEKKAVLLFINQVRANVGVKFGDKEITPAGKALKFHASARIRIMGGAAVKDHEQHIGKDVTVMAWKNKLAPPFRKARVRLMYETGWDDEWSTLDFAKEAQLIEQDATGEEALREATEKLMKCGWNPAHASQDLFVAPEASRKKKEKGEQEETDEAGQAEG